MIGENDHGNMSNFLGNNFENDMRILTGELKLTKIRQSDIEEILAYGWDRRDVEKMVDENDVDGITGLAAWIREAGNVDHGLIAEDDTFYYPLGDDGCFLGSVIAEEYQ
ncbi:MAG: hypothetical protein RBR71_11390 [Gudongella sp.]|nr:hypothetical protein [Gudongella sp.]